MANKNKQASIESTYQKKSQLEHILLRPDTYIGSTEHTRELMWIFDKRKKCMAQKEISFVPGLYKIFDEILVNAADNKQRDSKMSCIRIDISSETNTISVWNNGKGIPVVMHKEENMFVPTMIFGHLLTSSNYDDDEEKVVGGRNGYGAKLCNIFSTKFTVETASTEYLKHFKQTWGDNMSKASEPKISSHSGEDFTKITFCPDLKKFKMDSLNDDIVALMSRRAYDIAASTRGVSVMLNGERISVNSFKDYVELHLKDDDNGDMKKSIVHEVVNDRWEVAVTISEKGFQQVSFVNSIATTKGGRHIDYVADIMVKQLLDSIKKKNKGGVNIRPFQVKNHMWLFVNCLIVNPTFDSQTKENMTTQAKKFGSKCDLSDKFMQAYAKSGLIEQVLIWAKFKAQNELAKQSGKKQSKLKGIPKLEDANEAGTKNAHNCTLILTEGDSAKCLAVSGLGVVGRDYYGVFPLRGKLLNVREATHKQILENAEINNLIKILGLQYKKKYTSLNDLKTLRYGKVMIMTDQDQDGSHIKGLIINFVHTFWPDLLQLKFLEVFITPIVKVTNKKRIFSFYSLPEYEEWKQNTPDFTKFSVKYYKGLGTSTSAEAKEYFKDMERHRIALRYTGNEDDQHILLAFSKKEIEGRKEWLLRHNEDVKQRKELGLPDIYLYAKGTKTVSFTEYVNKELVHYSNGDNIRSIPSMVDGLKPGQRKVLFTCIIRNDKREVKVAQLAGSVAEKSAYHHGEQSLCMTIVNLAQNYVGSNNINLLEPRGQFGTRLNGGKDAASPRYIFTKMSPLTRLIFHPHDDAILKYEIDDNQKVEPFWYIPIIPMCLVNGSDGIGTGWRSRIPNYNPREIVDNIYAMMNGQELKPLIPWYKNFTGTVSTCIDQRYITSGEITVTGENEIQITELPIGTWTQSYKENVLELMLHGNEKTTPVLADYKEYSTDTTVKFVITTLPGQLKLMEKEGLHGRFKLQSILYTSTMILFDQFGGIKKYDYVDEIFKDFYELRLKMYFTRKVYLENLLEAETQRLTYQAKFIVEKCNGKIVVENKKRLTLVAELIKHGYPEDPVKVWKENRAKELNEEPEREPSDHENDNDDVLVKKEKLDEDKAAIRNFDYLLGMSMWMLTLEKKNQLLKQRDDKMTELNILREKTPSDLWVADLGEFSKKLDELEEKEKAEEAEANMKLKTKKNIKKIEVKEISAGRRVQPRISMHVEKATKVQISKEKKVNKQRKESDKTVKTEEVKDEFDLMFEENTKTLKEKLGGNKFEKHLTIEKPSLKNKLQLNEKSSEEVKDEFDLMFEENTRTLKEKLGGNKLEKHLTIEKPSLKNESQLKEKSSKRGRPQKNRADGLVQTTLQFSNQTKKANTLKKNNKQEKDKENLISIDSDDDYAVTPHRNVKQISNKPLDICIIDSDAESGVEENKNDKKSRNKRTKKIYTKKSAPEAYDDTFDSDKDMFSEDSFSGKKPQKKISKKSDSDVISSDSESEPVKKSQRKTSKKYFKSDVISSDPESEPVKISRKKMPKISDSDEISSDYESEPVKKSQRKTSKKNFKSDVISFGSESEPVKKSRKKMSKISDSDEISSDYESEPEKKSQKKMSRSDSDEILSDSESEQEKKPQKKIPKKKIDSDVISSEPESEPVKKSQRKTSKKNFKSDLISSNSESEPVKKSRKKMSKISDSDEISSDYESEPEKKSQKKMSKRSDSDEILSDSESEQEKKPQKKIPKKKIDSDVISSEPESEPVKKSQRKTSKKNFKSDLISSNSESEPVKKSQKNIRKKSFNSDVVSTDSDFETSTNIHNKKGKRNFDSDDDDNAPPKKNKRN